MTINDSRNQASAATTVEAGEAPVLYEDHDDIAVIRLNRPHRLNAVTPELVDELGAALERATADAPAVCVLRGEGRAFCAGHDLKDDRPAISPEEERHRLQHLQDVTRKIRQAPFPVIAAVHGYALGAGCEFALCSDLIVATRSARFGFPEVSVGLGITGGISHVLPLAVSLAKAKELVLLGEHIDAATAAQLGLINWVVDDDRLDEKVTELTRQLRQRPRLAMSLAKMALDRGAESGIDAAYQTEVSNSLTLFGTEDAADASAAFRRRSEERAGRR